MATRVALATVSPWTIPPRRGPPAERAERRASARSETRRRRRRYEAGLQAAKDGEAQATKERIEKEKKAEREAAEKKRREKAEEAARLEAAKDKEVVDDFFADLENDKTARAKAKKQETNPVTEKYRFPEPKLRRGACGRVARSGRRQRSNAAKIIEDGLRVDAGTRRRSSARARSTSRG